MNRVFNFNPGPATLPLEVLKIVQEELLDYKGVGMSILEISHRSKDFEAVLEEAKTLLRKHLGLPDNYHILFVGGGASQQFAMIPMNFLAADQSADYLNTGTWSQKAISEAKLFGKVNIAASSEADKFTYIPSPDQIKLDPNAVYVHITSNNTIYGSQWQEFPDVGKTPLICDMSSDILSRRMDASKFAMIYAGAQKNLGPAGVTVLIIREDFAAKQKPGLTKILSYSTHIKENSLYNTPPSFAIYIVKLVLQWIDQIGGMPEVEKRNKAKKELIYAAIDNSGGFYKGSIRPDSRSGMNVTWRLGSEELEEKLVKEAKAAGLIGLKGHRSAGGIRASMYNAMPVAGVEKLVEFMADFKKKN
jgi:phosphoserine aminotransferase